MATLKEIREWFPGYWEVGSGNFALVCPSARRITFCQVEAEVRMLQHVNCSRDCKRYDGEPHRGIRVEPAPAPGVKLSSSFKAMVRDA